MSWICNPCHVVGTGRPASDIHFQGSFGPCEDCHVPSDCAHCQCNYTYPLVDVEGNIIPQNVERAVKKAAVSVSERASNISNTDSGDSL